VISGAVAVFLAAFMFDIEAVARLFWSCLAGHEGPQVRLAAFGILLLISCMLACAFYRPARPPPAKVRRKAAKRSVLKEARTAPVEAADGGLPRAKRRGRKDTSPATEPA
jgi:hypothetical protein